MSTQHKAIDIAGKVSVFQRFKRANGTGSVKCEADRAMDALLSRQLKSVKAEVKSEVAMNSESSGTNIPDMEWWDELVLVNPDSINHLVEHPIPLLGNRGSAKAPGPQAKAFLTEKERDKLRRLKKKEKEQDMQDKIRMGLMKPPPPRIKLKNLMRVVGQEAVAGPSAVEQAARAQAEQRVQEHEQRNLERKLTPEQRRAKHIAKWTKSVDHSNSLKTSVFAIFTDVDGKARFKICKNAEQLHLSGIFVHRKNDSSLVVVEGSRKSVKRFDRLMLHRINWSNSDEQMKDDNNSEGDDESDSDDESTTALKQSGDCLRIFHGLEAKDGGGRNYSAKWTYIEVKEGNDAVSVIEQKGFIHYWEMLSRYRSASSDI